MFEGVANLLNSLNGWHWLVLGIVLLLLEALGVGGILLGAGVAAMLLAAVLAFVPIVWQAQLVIFGVLTLIFTILFWKFFRIGTAENATSKLNNRMAQLIGIRASLIVGVKGGRGKAQIQDALWTVTCEVDLPAGTLVEVTGYEGDMLHVTKV